MFDSGEHTVSSQINLGSVATPHRGKNLVKSAFLLGFARFFRHYSQERANYQFTTVESNSPQLPVINILAAYFERNLLEFYFKRP